ncbi:hypothetical protein B0H10DRAFT_1973776 [Mycena sp. CBHHK59/15]|nr:hypothetical protein B0H10DRAFT_1973776 [Mycena sp. CBHHK59/15]
MAVDLLRNRDLSAALGSFDGKVVALAHLGDDSTLWPQQWTARYCHLPAIAKKEARPDLAVMWWELSPADFIVGSTVTWGLGRLRDSKLSQFLPPINELVTRCKELQHTSHPTPISPLFGQLIQSILMLMEQLQALPTMYQKMVFALTLLQRGCLELDALYLCMMVYKPQMDSYLTAPTINISVLRSNSTNTKIAAIHSAAALTPWYHDPFESTETRARAPSPPSVASTFVARQPARSNNQQCFKPYTSKSPAKAQGKAPPKAPAKVEWDKFVILVIPEMPPSIVAWADALTQPALLINSTPDRNRKFLHHWSLLRNGFMWILSQPNCAQRLSMQQWRDILEGHMVPCSRPDSRAHRRSMQLEEHLRPALEACKLPSIEGFPVPRESLPKFSIEQIREIVWEVAETSSA